MFKSKIFGRDWFPMSRRSRKPRVISSACLWPLRSSSAFVATVVDSLMYSADGEHHARGRVGVERTDLVGIERGPPRDLLARRDLQYAPDALRWRIVVVGRILRDCRPVSGSPRRYRVVQNVRSFTTISLRSSGFSGSGNEACTSQKVPPLSAHILIDLSGIVGIVTVQCRSKGLVEFGTEQTPETRAARQNARVSSPSGRTGRPLHRCVKP